MRSLRAYGGAALQYCWFAGLMIVGFTFSLSVSAFNKLEGVFVIKHKGQAWQSFKKNINPDKQFVSPGETYPLLGENKPGGDWVQVKTEAGLRWVHKALGQIHITESHVKESHVKKGDIYTLALSWQPGFCALNQQRQLPECQNAQVNWVLHGLWPSNRKPPHPSYCRGSFKKSACDYPPLGLEGSQLLSLAVIMPGVKSCRQRYQWYKHGSCSGLSPGAFFDTAIRYTQWFRNSPVAIRLITHQGKQVSKKAVLVWFRDWGADDGSVTLHCQPLKNQAVLQDIYLYLNRELSNTPSIEQLVKTPFHHECGDRFMIP